MGTGVTRVDILPYSCPTLRICHISLPFPNRVSQDSHRWGSSGLPRGVSATDRGVSPPRFFLFSSLLGRPTVRSGSSVGTSGPGVEAGGGVSPESSFLDDEDVAPTFWTRPGGRKAEAAGRKVEVPVSVFSLKDSSRVSPGTPGTSEVTRGSQSRLHRPFLHTCTHTTHVSHLHEHTHVDTYTHTHYTFARVHVPTHHTRVCTCTCAYIRTYTCWTTHVWAHTTHHSRVRTRSFTRAYTMSQIRTCTLYTHVFTYACTHYTRYTHTYRHTYSGACGTLFPRVRPRSWASRGERLLQGSGSGGGTPPPWPVPQHSPVSRRGSRTGPARGEGGSTTHGDGEFRPN